MLKIKLIVALCLAAATAQAQAIGNPSHGLRLAKSQCSECHLVEKKHGRSPTVTAPTFDHIANVSGMTSAALTAALRTSHRTMPNLIIKGRDMSDLVAYILSLKTSR